MTVTELKALISDYLHLLLLQQNVVKNTDSRSSDLTPPLTDRTTLSKLLFVPRFLYLEGGDS